jgi:predicted ABC-type ATPase
MYLGPKMTNEERIEFIVANADTLVAQLRELSALQEQIRQAQKALGLRTLALKTEVLETDATEYH